jgi:hypothetical protein
LTPLLTSVQKKSDFLHWLNREHIFVSIPDGHFYLITISL